MRICLINVVFENYQICFTENTVELVDALTSIQEQTKQAEQLKLADFQHQPNSFLDNLPWQDIEELDIDIEFEGFLKTIQYFPTTCGVYRDFSE